MNKWFCLNPHRFKNMGNKVSLMREGCINSLLHPSALGRSNMLSVSHSQRVGAMDDKPHPRTQSTKIMDEMVCLTKVSHMNSQAHLGGYKQSNITRVSRFQKRQATDN